MKSTNTRPLPENVIELLRKLNIYNLKPRSSKPVMFGLWNARSIKNKTTSITDFIISNNIDILAITETWMSGNERDDHTIADLNTSLPNFQIYHISRTSSKGGGICVILRKSFIVKQLPSVSVNTFEYIDLTLSSQNNLSTRIVIIYRPQLDRNKISTATPFIQEFSSLLEQYSTVPNRLLIAGDFNYHFDVPDDHHVSTLSDLLTSANMTQHITFPTHEKGHTLDLILTRKTDNFADQFDKTFSLPSDHAAILCALSICKPTAPKTKITYRNLSQINIQKFRTDITTSSLLSSKSTNVNELVHLYEHTLSSLLDIHAPLISRYITARPHAPWFDRSIQREKQKTRKHERKWLKSRLESDKISFKLARSQYNNMIIASKTRYYSNELANCDTKQLFRKINKLSNPISKNYESPNSSLANNLQAHFITKITKINKNFSNNPDITNKNNKCLSEFSIFPLITNDETKKIIMTSSTTTCDLDPIPTTLLKSCINEISPVITKIINISLQTGIFPDKLKIACIIPIMKKKSADPDDLNNYRPIANLTFLSKVIERAVSSHLINYLTKYNLFGNFQSAYRSNHSTETALLRVMNDLLLSLDKGNDCFLILLDYSAAFDTISHDILLNRLTILYGIKNTVLNWFTSYFENRSQFVMINKKTSFEHKPKEGVPQGSVIGPLIFILYTADVENIISSFGLSKMLFADDTQMYIDFTKDSIYNATYSIERCLTHIKNWSTHNHLKLNNEKTVAMHIHSRYKDPVESNPMKFDDNHINFSPSACNLGLIINDDLFLNDHINRVCRSASISLYKIGKLRKYISKDTCHILIHAFVLSRLDNCNALLGGLPIKHLKKLQMIQNSAARLISRSKFRNHITPVLKELHWLPIKARIMYKIIQLTFKCRNNLAPVYLTELIKEYHPHTNLRSAKQYLLTSQTYNMATYGSRAFSYLSPKYWNDLPYELRSVQNEAHFKKSLKTYLFNLFYK